MVVFNFPEGDTVIANNTNTSYYGECRLQALIHHTDYAHGRAKVWRSSDIIYRPIDKEDNYIKRCVAIAGDTLKIVDKKLIINGKEAFLASTAQYKYDLKVEGQMNPKRL